MSHLVYITGAAGTGKTYNLSDELLNWFEVNSLSENQSALAITRMHGSRKRLNERLKSKSITGRLTIATVDSFALEIVNRWRLSLGYSSSIVPIVREGNAGFIKDELGYRATFTEIEKSAADLTKSPLVAKTIANTYPVILVDEFQDCTDNQLSLIQNLFGYVDLILAADPFQALDGDESACNWLDGLGDQEFKRVIRLTQNRRTDCSYLHAAASALLNNQPAIYTGAHIPIIPAARYNYAVWKTIPKIQFHSTIALIYPAKRILKTLSQEAISQNEKSIAKGGGQLYFPWTVQLSDDELSSQMYTDFNEAVHKGRWKKDKTWSRIYAKSMALSKAKGYNKPQEIFIKHAITLFIQARKFTTSRPIVFEATTVHGAKNREFDHVIVFWDDHALSKCDDQKKRRLLYNAITRAKTTCKIIVIGTDKQIASCPVLSLIR